MSLDQQSYPAFDIGTGWLSPDPEIMNTGRVAMDVYTSQDRFEREREIFGRVWLNVAEAAEIPNSGDWITREVKIRSASLILVRGKDMRIRCFHNICSHRGMKLVWEEKGHNGRFSCPYHAWTYGSAGELMSVPDEQGFPDLDKQESGLTRVACDVWEGLVFINLDPSPRQTLAEYLGPVASRLEGIPFDAYPYAARVNAVIDTNWKLALEAQCETYHIRTLHSRTLSKLLASKENPFVHLIEWNPLGPHRASSIPLNPGFEMAADKPVQNFSFLNAGHMVVKKEGTVEAGRTFAEHPGINPSKTAHWSNDQFALYPHFVCHVSLGGWWFHRFWPLAPGKTHWESVHHFAEPTNLRSIFATQYSLALNRDTLTEDNSALVQQQQVMESGAKPCVQFGRQEMMCVHMAAVSEAVARDCPG